MVVQCLIFFEPTGGFKWIEPKEFELNKYTRNTPFFNKQSIFDPRPENCSAFLKICPKKLFSDCLIDGPLTSIV